jgi:hypothetical protein
MLSRIDILTAAKRIAEVLVDALAVVIFWAALGGRRRSAAGAAHTGMLSAAGVWRRFALRLFNTPNIGPQIHKRTATCTAQ